MNIQGRRRVPCVYFLQGYCKAGNQCPYLHDPQPFRPSTNTNLPLPGPDLPRDVFPTLTSTDEYVLKRIPETEEAKRIKEADETQGLEEKQFQPPERRDEVWFGRKKDDGKGKNRVDEPQRTSPASFQPPEPSTDREQKMMFGEIPAMRPALHEDKNVGFPFKKVSQADVDLLEKKALAEKDKLEETTRRDLK